MTTPAHTGRTSLAKVLAPIFVILALVVGGLLIVKSRLPEKSGHEKKDSGSDEIRVGAVIKDFTLYQFPSGDVRMSEVIEKSKAKVVLINFWATWCASCVTEMPSLLKLRDTYRAKGFDAVFVDMDDNPEQVLPRAMKQFNFTGTMYMDQDTELGDLFDIHAIPLTVVLDKDRKILFLESGERDWVGDETRTMIERWLSG